MQLLEACSFAAGIVRACSNDPTNRKRLSHLGAVDAMNLGLKAACRCVTASKKLCADSSTSSGNSNGNSSGISRTSSTSSSGMSASVGPAGARLHKEVRQQVGRVVEQLAGAFKNFATDSAGRSHVQVSLILRRKCVFLYTVGILYWTARVSFNRTLSYH